MDVKIMWEKRLSFSGSADSGFKVRLGGDPEVGGDNDGPRPLELVAIGLAGCTAMDVVSILKKKEQNLDGFQVRLSAARAEDHPRVFTSFSINYIIEGGNIDEEAVIRAIELSETKYCPALAMFRNIAPIDSTYEIIAS